MMSSSVRAIEANIPSFHFTIRDFSKARFHCYCLCRHSYSKIFIDLRNITGAIHATERVTASSTTSSTPNIRYTKVLFSICLKFCSMIGSTNYRDSTILNIDTSRICGRIIIAVAIFSCSNALHLI